MKKIVRLLGQRTELKNIMQKAVIEKARKQRNMKVNKRNQTTQMKLRNKMRKK